MFFSRIVECLSYSLKLCWKISDLLELDRLYSPQQSQVLVSLIRLSSVEDDHHHRCSNPSISLIDDVNESGSENGNDGDDDDDGDDGRDDDGDDGRDDDGDDDGRGDGRDDDDHRDDDGDDDDDDDRKKR